MEEYPMEPDYKKFEELMAFWKTMAHEMHVSWHEALEAASALPEGKRSPSEILRLVTKALDSESFDLQFLDQKLPEEVSKWPTLITKEDVEQNMPMAFGRLLGMKEPETPMRNVWDNYYTPLASTREMGSIWETVTSILRMLSLGERSWGYEFLEDTVKIQFRKFKAYLKQKYQPWNQEWTIQFPELLEAFPTNERRAALDEEFYD